MDSDLRVLVIGGSGFVGAWTCARLGVDGHDVVTAARASGEVAVDLAEPGAGARAVADVAPDAVVLLAAVPDIAPCRDDPALARRVNVDAAGEVAAACAARGARLVHVSTDQVFDGTRGGWREDDEARPIHEYGRSKLAGERVVLDACGGAVVARLGLVTGRAPHGRRSATSGFLAALDRGESPTMFTDEVRSPVAVDDVALALADLCAVRDVTGVVHVGGDEALTRRQLGLREAEAWGADPAQVGETTRAAVGLADVRPGDLSLVTRHDPAEVTPRVAARAALRVVLASGERAPFDAHVDVASIDLASAR